MTCVDCFSCSLIYCSERIDPEDLREALSRLLEEKLDPEVFKTKALNVISGMEAITLVGSVRTLVNTHSRSQSPEVEYSSEDVEEVRLTLHGRSCMYKSILLAAL